MSGSTLEKDRRRRRLEPGGVSLQSDQAGKTPAHRAAITGSFSLSP
jgi:hypothetical protein